MRGEFDLSLHISSETPIDLQLHTTYSDGRWSAEHLFEYLAHEGFGLVAVTDHDRVDTVESIQQGGLQKQMPVLPTVGSTAILNQRKILKIGSNAKLTIELRGRGSNDIASREDPRRHSSGQVLHCYH